MTLVFKAFKRADDLYRKTGRTTDMLVGKPVDVDQILEEEDDFGCNLRINMSDVAAVSFSEYEKDMDKNMDLQIIQHKSTLKGQARARSDVGIQMLEGTPSQVLRQ